MLDTARDVRTNSYVTNSCGPLHMDEQRQDEQPERSYNSPVPIQDVGLRTYWRQWTIVKDADDMTMMIMSIFIYY